MADKVVSLKVVVDTATGTVNVENLNNELKETVAATEQVAKQSKQVGQDVQKGFKSAEQSAGLAGASVMEFSRVMSDLPYGIQGVANNIGQLSSLFSGLVGQTGGVKNAFKAMRSQLTGPLGVIVVIQTLLALLQTDFFGNFISRITQGIPLFEKVASWFNKIKKSVQDFTDEIGLSNFELERQAKAIDEMGKSSENYISILQAQGGKEKEIHDLKMRQVDRELEILMQQVKDKGKASDEDLAKEEELMTKKEIIQIDYDNFLTKKSKERADKAKKEREEREKEELEWLETVKKINEDLQQEFKKGAEESEKKMDEIFARQKQLTEQRLKLQKEADEIIIELGEIEETGEFEAQKRRENELAYDLKVRQDHANKLVEIARKKQENLQFYEDLTMQGLGIISNMNEVFANKSEQNAKKAFENNKKIQIAEALVSTYFAAQKAYASQIIPLDPTSIVRAQIAAGVAIVSGLSRVAKIKSMKYDSASSSMDSIGGASGLSSGTQSQSTGLTPLTPQSVRSRKDAEPVKVFVTETDIRAASGRVSDIQSKAVVK